MDYLNSFQTGKLIEKPAATGIHQEGMTLDLEQFQHDESFVLIEGMSSVLVQEPLHVLR